MEKFLFTDGTNGVREVQSQEKLQNLIESAEQPDKIRIWLFSTNEWISYATFRKKVPVNTNKEKGPATVNKPVVTNNQHPAKKSHWIKKVLYVIGTAAGIFLVFNFTKIKWQKAGPITVSAVRPDNVPAMDIDSLIWEIEESRGQLIDRNTKNNLRLRNTWPDRIELKLHADKEISSAGSRFFNVDISIDNTTGFNLDNAVVKLLIWNNDKVSTIDTLHFNNIRYDKLLTRQLEQSYRADSISVAFESLKSKAFNFCYSVTAKNNSGNYNDRWFCRE